MVSGVHGRHVAFLLAYVHNRRWLNFKGIVFSNWTSNLNQLVFSVKYSFCAKNIWIWQYSKYESRHRELNPNTVAHLSTNWSKPTRYTTIGLSSFSFHRNCRSFSPRCTCALDRQQSNKCTRTIRSQCRIWHCWPRDFSVSLIWSLWS